MKPDSRMKIKTTKSHEKTRKSSMQRLAGTFIGQAILMQLENLLWSLEKTAAWISNGKTDGRKGKAPVGLIRPLPWIFFLPTLIFLRNIRIILSLGAICLGFEEIQASTMATFLHRSRRNLHKIKHLSKKHDENNTRTTSPETIVISLLSTIKGIYARFSDTDIKMHYDKSALETVESDSGQDSKSDSEDENYKNLLNRSLDETESDDEDFVYKHSGTDSYSDESEEGEDASFFEDGEVNDVKIFCRNFKTSQMKDDETVKPHAENDEAEAKIDHHGNGDVNGDEAQNDFQMNKSQEVEVEVEVENHSTEIDHQHQHHS